MSPLWEKKGEGEGKRENDWEGQNGGGEGG